MLPDSRRFQPQYRRRRHRGRVGFSRRAMLTVGDHRSPSYSERSRRRRDRRLHILFVAGLDETRSRELAGTAHLAGRMVNVEDVPALCDFHVPAQVRRGDLLLTVSTGGRSPGLAHALRQDLERRFGPEWADRLGEIADLRAQWRAAGIDANAVSERTQALLAERGWAA